MVHLVVLLALALGVFPALAADRRFTFTHYAGTDGGNGPDDGKGPAARFFSPVGIGTDAAGNVYVADLNNGTIRRIAPDGTTTTLAGLAGVVGKDDGTGVAASFNAPGSVAVDASGNAYVADILNQTIRKITPAGVVTTFAGTGYTGVLDGQGTKAYFNYPNDVAVDAAGNIYVADTLSNTIRKITPSGTVTTLAGEPQQEGNSDGIGKGAHFRSPQGVAVDAAGNVYVADTRNDAIRKIATSGVVSTLAGNFGPGRADGTGSAASFYRPTGITVGAGGNLYVSDTDNNLIRKVTPAGVVTTIAGGTEFSNSGSTDGTGRDARFASPYDIAADAAGNLYVADGNNQAIRKITGDSVVTTLAGKAPVHLQVDGPLLQARFREIRDMTKDSAGNIFMIDGHTIRRISAGTVTTIAGVEPNGPTEYVDGSQAAARFDNPLGLAVDGSGNVYVAENSAHTIRKVTPQGTVSTFAGARNQSGRTDGALSAARFSFPNDVAIDGDGTMYVTEDCAVRKIATDGTVSTVAGQLIPPARGCFDNVDGPLGTAKINAPGNISVDGAGNLYITTTRYFGSSSIRSTVNSIRKIARDGFVSTLAGDNGPREAYRDGRGTGVSFYNIGDLALDAGGNVYVTEPKVHAVRKVTPDGIVTTIGGLPGTQGTADGTAFDSRFTTPNAIVVDATGNLYVSEATGGIRIGQTALADEATIDLLASVPGNARQLDTAPQTATSWNWQMIRQPTPSHAALSSSAIRNPSFTPDLADLYEFRLTASSSTATSISTTFVLTAGGVDTAAGSNVNVTGPGLTLTFPAVTSAGRSIIAFVDASFAAPLPGSAYDWGAWDVTTSASFTPPASVCVSLTNFVDAISWLPAYSLYHQEGAAFVDRTSSRDASTGRICASVSTLGRFALGGPVPRRRGISR